MNKNEIMQTFLNNGYQLSGDALGYFENNPEKVKMFLDLATGRMQKQIVTKETIDNILSKVSPEMDVRVIRNFSKKEKNISIESLSNILTKRYEKISSILSNKKELTNLISINRASKIRKFSLIAMVKEIHPDERTLVIEDPTGTTSVYIPGEVEDFNYLVEDEVIGLICDNEDSSENKAVKIVYPDISLFTKVARTGQETTCLFVSDIHMDDPKFQEHSLEKFGNYLKKIKGKAIVFVLGDVSKKTTDVKKFERLFPENFSIIFLKGELKKDDKENWLSDPVIVDVGGVKMFLSHGNRFSKYFEKFKTTPENMLLQLLKKRHMSPTLDQKSGMDDEKLVIEDVPDIFVIGHYHTPKIMNYKGATLISLGSFVTQPIFWAINLKTRENIKIDLT